MAATFEQSLVENVTAKRERLLAQLHAQETLDLPERPAPTDDELAEQYRTMTEGGAREPAAPRFRPLSEEWNDPHEVEMRRLYAEQERHQIEADEEEELCNRFGSTPTQIGHGDRRFDEER